MIPSYNQQLKFVDAGLAVKKTDGIFDTFKYSRKVMFQNLWGMHEGLLDCRGHVYDNRNGNLVQAAPSKCFNYRENGHWSDINMDQPVVMYKKYNGFMACASIYQGQLVVSTTGTTNSDYAELAKSKIVAMLNARTIELDDFSTNVYEIVDNSDPHIVREIEGVYSLGFRFKDGDNEWIPLAINHKAKQMQFGDALSFVQTDKGEGYMVYRIEQDGSFRNTGDVCKLKTPYYTGKKKLMRMKPENVLRLYSGNLQGLPEVWDNLAIEITKTFSQESWLQMKDQERRVCIEELEPNYLEIK